MGRVIFTAKHSDGKTKVTIDVPGMDEDPSGIADVVLQHGPNSRTVTIENFTVGEVMDTIREWTADRLDPKTLEPGDHTKQNTGGLRC